MTVSIAEAIKRIDNLGSGIIIGKSQDGRSLLTAYFVCCSSSAGLHRRFVEDGGGITIESTEESNAVTDLIYQPVLTFENKVLIGNGNHVEAVYTALSEGKSFHNAVKCDGIEENKGVKLTTLVDIVGDDFNVDMRLSKPLSQDSSCIARESFSFSSIKPGTAFMLTENIGSYGLTKAFEGEPIVLDYNGSIFDVVADIWENMNSLNRVSLWVRETELISHRAISRIINRNNR